MKKELSDKYSLYSKKYFLGILFIMIGFLLIKSLSFLYIVIAIFFLVAGLFYINLRRIKFDNDFVYIGNKKYEFKKNTKLSSIEINLICFTYFEIEDFGKKRRIITDIGSASLVRIILGILFSKLDPNKNLKEFKELFDKSRNN